jgi:CubicO group peptidase (beta-lactamase class C family)
LIERFPAAQTWLAAFSTVDVAQTAMGRALFGETPIGGQLPVSIPAANPPLRIGDSLHVASTPMTLVHAPAARDAKLAAAYALLNKAAADHAFSGGVLAIGLDNEISVRTFGHLTYDAGSPAVTTATLYDLASLTKPVVTATLIAQEVEAGRLKLDAPISVFLPEWLAGPDRAARSKVTIQHLLTHTSGLPAHVDYFLTDKSQREIISRILHEPLVYAPGAKSDYSDLDFILLGEILECLTGHSLDDLAQERVFAPLGMHDSQFNPPAKSRALIAPTEYDPAFRNRLMQGEVHDENAYAMGGVAGHAGLFSTASDLAAFAQMLLNGGIYAQHRVLRRATIEQFTLPQSITGGTRTLGWVVPTENSSSGHYFSARSFGHTGFTGTSLWIDPEKHLFVILLTNRVHPSRDNDKLAQLRPALHDAIVQALGLATSQAAPQSK